MNLKQIAQAANLSLSTVSLVLNGKPGVKAETRERVARMLEEQGYTVRTEQPVIRDPMQTILFLRYRGPGCLMESKDDFFIQILDGVEQQARQLGFRLQIANTDKINLRETLSGAGAGMAGVVLFATELEAEHVSVLENCQAPLVAIDAVFPNRRVNTVSVENTEAMYQAVSYLYGLGHRNIGYLHSIEQTGAIPEREAGYYAAMEALGLKVQPELVYKLYLFMDRTYDQMVRLLDEKPALPTAFVADNDALAVGAMRALQDHGYRVPGDISIVGFDDSYIGTISNPLLTTLHSPKHELGRTAVKRLADMLEEKRRTVVKVRICTELVERDSAAPPKEA